MAFVENWVETDPDGSVVTVSLLDNWIRKTKLAVRERMEFALIAPGTWGSTPYPRFIGGPVSTIFRNNVNNTNNLVVWDSGVITTRGYVGSSSESPGSIVIGDGASGIGGSSNLHMMYNGIVLQALKATAAGAYAAMYVGASSLLPVLPPLLVGQLPTVGVAPLNGLIVVDNTNNRLVYYAGSLRYHLTGVSF